MGRDHDNPSYKATFRYYAELNDFLADENRYRDFEYHFHGNPGIRDALGATGVPPAEVDLIVANGVSVGFEYRLVEGDMISVYPVFESLDISPIVHLRPEPLRETRFILDAHLGRLARFLRFLGFDSSYDRLLEEGEIIDRALSGHRIILTRDIGLLKSKKVTHGYWIRDTDPRRQVEEVLDRFDLREQIRPFTRCSVCNGDIVKTDLRLALEEAPEKVRSWCREFFRCSGCGRLYWKGTHYDELVEFVDSIISRSPL